MGLPEISFLFAISAVFAILAKYLKQPLLIGYLFAGVALSAFGFFGDSSSIADLGKVGVALLLFLVGMEFKLQEIPTLGKVALYTGLGQIIFTSVIGYFLSYVLGFGIVPSIYIAVALTFSSTIIVIKLLSEKGDLGSLYGKISIGFLLVQDLVAILILMFLGGVRNGETGYLDFIFVLIKVVILFGLTWYLSKKALPSIFNKLMGKSEELLFIGSIAWALGVSALVGGPLGFSFEIGGFLAGLALSNLPEHLGVVSKTKPLRDFFLTIFFLSLGASLALGNFNAIVVPALIFSAFVLLGNPLIVMAVMGLLGYKKRTSFMASVTVAQISEFSFILMAMGVSLGHVGQTEASIVTVVGVITMTASTYMITSSNKIFNIAKNYLGVFERRNTREEYSLTKNELGDHIVLLGANRMGSIIINYFRKNKVTFVVADHNPQVIQRLTADKINTVFGDIEDEEVLDALNMGASKLVISSVPTLEDNLKILEYLKEKHARPMTVFKAKTRSDALQLYENGASWVIVPEVASGEFLRHVFVNYGINEVKIKKMGERNFKHLVSLKLYT